MTRFKSLITKLGFVSQLLICTPAFSGIEIGNGLLINPEGAYRLPKVLGWSYSIDLEDERTTRITKPQTNESPASNIKIGVVDGVDSVADFVQEWITNQEWSLVTINGLRGIRIDGPTKRNAEIRLFRANNSEVLSISVDSVTPETEEYITLLQSLK